MSARPEDETDTSPPPTEDALAQPAGLFLARLPWEGAPPDPDVVDAASYLEWL